MEEVGKLLPTLFKRQWSRQDSRMIEILSPLWPRVAGKGIAENTSPAAFVGGTLTLQTTCASWAVELRRMREEIRSGINQSLGCSAVKEIKVQLAPNLGQRDPETPKAALLAAAPKKVDEPRFRAPRVVSRRRSIEH